jgi:membrane-bound metal-dependent hydrolase YbcI (DUF457 family)
MPSPIGHSLGAYALAQASRTSAHSRALLLYAMGIACLPDIDVVPGIIIGPPGLYRHGLTHSLVAAFVVALVAAGFAAATRRRAGYIFVFTLGMYCSHLLLDMLRASTIPIHGLQIFWPFDHTHYNLPIHIFGHTTESGADRIIPTAADLWANVRMIGLEILVLAPVAALARLLRKRRDVGFGRL